jgi:hypothetical protein
LGGGKKQPNNPSAAITPSGASWPKNGKKIMKNKYKISECSQAGHDFRDTFQTSIEPFFDNILSIFLKEVRINPFRFDDYLHAVHGEYEEEGLTMEDVVQKHYGKNGLKMLKSLI